MGKRSACAVRVRLGTVGSLLAGHGGLWLSGLCQCGWAQRTARADLSSTAAALAESAAAARAAAGAGGWTDARRAAMRPSRTCAPPALCWTPTLDPPCAGLGHLCWTHTRGTWIRPVHPWAYRPMTARQGVSRVPGCRRHRVGRALEAQRGRTGQEALRVQQSIRSAQVAYQQGITPCWNGTTASVTRCMTSLSRDG